MLVSVAKKLKWRHYLQEDATALALFSCVPNNQPHLLAKDLLTLTPTVMAALVCVCVQVVTLLFKDQYWNLSGILQSTLLRICDAAKEISKAIDFIME